MDPALIREQQAFKKRALSQPVVEKRKARTRDDAHRPVKRHKPPEPKRASEKYDYKTMTGSSTYRFAILAKIVKFMKDRHQKGFTHPLAIDEILDETNQLDVGSRHRHWLSTEALVNNPKINVVDGNMFLFKPIYNIRDRRGLMKLLKNHDLHGLGGIRMDDVEDSLPKADKTFKSLGSHILFITRPQDKKKVLFYNDKDCQFKVDEDFQKLWRSVTVNNIDEDKIEEYLNKQGISSMQDVGIKKVFQSGQKRRSKKGKNFKKHNDHLSGVLEDYSEVTAKNK